MLTTKQLMEWEAFGLLEPFGPERQEIQLASFQAMFGNANRDSKAQPEPFKIGDFIIDYEAAFFRDAEPKKPDTNLSDQILSLFGKFETGVVIKQDGEVM